MDFTDTPPSPFTGRPAGRPYGVLKELTGGHGGPPLREINLIPAT